MIKNDRIDYKLVNIAIIAVIMYLVYHTGNLWVGIFKIIMHICTPFLIGFGVAYAVNPIVLKLRRRGIPKGVSILLVVLLIISLFIFMGYVISTTCVGQISTLVENLSDFINKLGEYDFNVNISALQETINNNLDDLVKGITKYVSNGAINLVSSSISFLGDALIGVAAFIYFLIDMDKIRSYSKKFFKKRSKKTFRFVKLLDEEMRNYLGGLVQVMIISVFEYGFVYLIIGHPNWILLGLMAGLSNLIPYFGGIITNIIAAVTAFIISPALLIRTIIAFAILSTIDSYVINPTVYGKTNDMHPLATIFALFAGGILFGIMGVFISFPLAIFIVTLYKFYKNDMLDYIEEIKTNNKKEAKES
jgi:predicted PurR-regulated permease PerM